MRYLALACDYDGTLAHGGQVDEATVAALGRVRDTGRRLILVTGRELDELIEIFPQIELFDRVVAENGALIYRPSSREIRTLADAPPEEFIDRLQQRGVEPLSVGHVIVATWTPHETVVLDAIRECGLEHQVIFNKGAVMVLPPGVNKATGLAVALEELGLSPHNVVAVGDAENDHALLALCECAVAVANALPALKERADFVTEGDHGAGVVELIDRLVNHDLAALEPLLRRHDILLGTDEQGREIRLKPYGINVLVAGPSGSGKSTITTGVLERLNDRGYQYCLIDPEGDYENFEDAIYLGSPKSMPNTAEILQVLEDPGENVAAGLLGIPLDDRPGFFEDLLPRLQAMRARSGRPHWILVDEAHHMLPSSWDPASLTLPQDLHGLLMITIHPDHVSRAILSTVDVVIAVGGGPEHTIRGFSEVLEEPPPDVEPVELKSGEALVWFRTDGRKPIKVRSTPGRTERRRHRRKYAEGELIPEEHFFFRGPDGKLNLRVQNLQVFIQIAEGVDDATWLYHLQQGDYSRWFETVIKDDELASRAAEVEQQSGISAEESRKRIKEAIEERYTLPA